MRFKAALIAILVELGSTEAFACVRPPTNACNAPLPAPPFSIPLEALSGYSVHLLAAGILLLVAAALIVGSKRISNCWKAAYAVPSIAVAHVCIHASITMQLGLISSCGCRAAEPFLPLAAIFGNPAFNVVLAIFVLAGAALVRAISNFRDSSRVELH